jgi:hypothetical protein
MPFFLRGGGRDFSFGSRRWRRSRLLRGPHLFGRWKRLGRLRWRRLRDFLPGFFRGRGLLGRFCRRDPVRRYDVPFPVYPENMLATGAAHLGSRAWNAAFVQGKPGTTLRTRYLHMNNHLILFDIFTNFIWYSTRRPEVKSILARCSIPANAPEIIT